MCGHDTLTQPNQSKLGKFSMNIVVLGSQPIIHVTDKIFPVSVLEWKVKSLSRPFPFQVILCDNGQIWKDKL
jgi:hypothetical protein